VKTPLLILLSLAGLLAGCASSNPQISVENNPQPLPNKSLARQWATELNTKDNTSPVTGIYLSDQFVFVYRQDGTSSVLDRPTGRLLHVDEPKDGVVRMHPPVVLKDRIVYPTTTYLEVFDFAGRYIPHPTHATDEFDKPFSQSLKYPIHTDVVGVGRLVFLGADFPGSGRAVAVDMISPYVPDLWELMIPNSSISATPALLKDIVYVASDSGQVMAVAAETRRPLWALEGGIFQTHGGVVAALAADQTGVYIASTDTKLYCIKNVGGVVKWQYYSGVPLTDGPVLTKDYVYQRVSGVGLVVIDKLEVATAKNPTYNREPKWIAAQATQFLAEDDTYAYLRSTDNQIVAFDKKTGQQKFTSKRNDLIQFAQNTKGDGMMYVATNGGRVMAVKPVLAPGQVGEIVLAPVQPNRVSVARAE
jgi:outer membrane protein assembly factor BamB